jgi:hypothetical protein
MPSIPSQSKINIPKEDAETGEDAKPPNDLEAGFLKNPTDVLKEFWLDLDKFDYEDED